MLSRFMGRVSLHLEDSIWLALGGRCLPRHDVFICFTYPHWKIAAPARGGLNPALFLRSDKPHIPRCSSEHFSWPPFRSMTENMNNAGHGYSVHLVLSRPLFVKSILAMCVIPSNTERSFMRGGSWKRCSRAQEGQWLSCPHRTTLL